MKYTGNICPGCQQPFNDDDDIVVCPECGSPQHRECYGKENKCVNSHLHSDSFMWEGNVNNEPAFISERPETIPCPNCGYENPKGSPLCKNCGMKFTLFGMNVVDAIDDENKRSLNTNPDIPTYNAPFTLGEGEGFDNIPAEADRTTAAQVENMLTDILTGNAEDTSDSRINLGGPFPLDDEIDGVRTNTVGNFIGTNALSYISKFKKMQSGNKISFNFAAFFFTPYWFFYRKLYKPGIIFMTSFLALGILALPSYTTVLEIYDKIVSVLSSASSIYTNEQIDQLSALKEQLQEAMPPMLIFALILLVIRLICGFIANPLYKKHVIKNAAAAETMNSKTAAMAHIVKHGGASVLIAGAAFFANEIISLLVSYLL